LQKQEETLAADHEKHQQEVAEKQQDAKAQLGLVDAAAGATSPAAATTATPSDSSSSSVQTKVDAAAAAAGGKVDLPTEAEMRAKYSTSTMKYAELVQRWVGWAGPRGGSRWLGWEPWREGHLGGGRGGW
jgi:hypothetical protein